MRGLGKVRAQVDATQTRIQGESHVARTAGEPQEHRPCSSLGSALLAGTGHAGAQVCFKGKTIDVIMGSAAGGGTDGTTRVGRTWRNICPAIRPCATATFPAAMAPRA